MPRLLPILAATLALAGGAVAVTGCGSDDDSSSSSTPAATTPAPATGGASADAGGDTTAARTPVTDVPIAMKDIAFDPKDQTVKIGQKVEWTNDDEVQHNVVADSGADFKSDIFGKGGTFSYTPKKAGTIAYECTLHPGMTGKLIVVK